MIWKSNRELKNQLNTSSFFPIEDRSITIPAGTVSLEGDLGVPDQAQGLIIFAHGSGSSRRSPRNRSVARFLRQVGLGTLLFDLLTSEEEIEDFRTGHLRFNIIFLAERLIAVTDWLSLHPDTQRAAFGFFGASTGAAAALIAASKRPNLIKAVVSRGGRPDLAGSFLFRVTAPTLFIVGGQDYPVINMNREAMEKIRSQKELVIIPGATHLFEEPGTLEEVARLAALWFKKFLTSVPEPS